jgi:MFS family permease
LPLVTRNIMLLTILFSLYLVFGNLLSPAWNSWIGDVVQEKERAKYFANRNRAVIVTLLFSVLIAGAILNYFSNVNIWVGFGILFGIAMTGRWVSFAYLQKQYEPEYIIDEKHSLSIREFARALRKTNFGNFTLFRSLFSVGVMIAAPFFAVYMLKNLHFSYIQYTAVILAPMLARILTLSYWGRYSEKFGNRNIMYVSIFIICFIPLAWLLSGYFFGSRNLIFPLLMIAEFISGFGWGGFELTSFNYSLEIVRPEKRAKSFAYFNVLWGVGVLIGGLLGSYLVKNLPPMILGLNIMFTLFAISTIVRFIVALIFVPKIKEVKIDKSMGEGELFFELVVAKPIDSAFHKTGSLLTFAQESLETIGLPAKKTVNIITEPFEPLINNVSYYLDGIAVKVETKNRRKTGKKKNPKALNKSTR